MEDDPAFEARQRRFAAISHDAHVAKTNIDFIVTKTLASVKKKLDQGTGGEAMDNLFLEMRAVKDRTQEIIDEFTERG